MIDGDDDDDRISVMADSLEFRGIPNNGRCANDGDNDTAAISVSRVGHVYDDEYTVAAPQCCRDRNPNAGKKIHWTVLGLIGPT